MVHGAPDNYQVEPRSTVYILNDMAELAVRLKAISSIDRFGDILELDDFSNGLGKINIDTSGTGASVDINTDAWLNKGFSVLLTGGSSSLKYGRVGLTTYFNDISKLGLETHFRPESNVDYNILQFLSYDGNNRYTFSIKFDWTNNKLYYLDKNNHYTELDDLSGYGVGYQIFYKTKLVGDISTGYYTRLRFNENTYDLSSYPALSVVNSTAPKIISYFYCFSTAGNNGTTYLDCIILTQNEP